MTDRCTQMALIGAGPVGLGMAKALLEHKISYEELEADDDLAETGITACTRPCTSFPPEDDGIRRLSDAGPLS